MIYKFQNQTLHIYNITFHQTMNSNHQNLGYKLMTSANHVENIDFIKAELEKYRSLVEYNQDGVFLIQDEIIQFCNPALASMIGYEVPELTGKAFRAVIAPEDLPTVFKRYRERQAGLQPPSSYEFRLLHKDGRTRIHVDMNVGIIEYQGKKATLGSLKDISDQKKIQMAFKQKQQRYQTLVETSLVGIAIADFQDNLTFVNQRFSQMLGYQQNELLGHNLGRLCSAEEFKKIQEMTSRRRDGISEAYESQFIQKNGKFIDVLIHASPFRNNEGTITATMAVVLDITEQKQVQKALQKSEKRYRNLIENSLVGIAQTDFEENIVFCNRYFADMLNYTQKELIGKNLADVTPKHEFEQFKFRTEQRKLGLADIYESTLITKQNKLLRAIVNIYPHFNDDDEIDGSIGIVLDITEYSQIEERFHNLFMHLPDAIIFINKNGNIIDANPAACEMIEFSQYELIEKNIAELIPPPYHQKWQENIQKIYQNRSWKYESSFRSNSGKEFTVEIQGFLGEPVRNPLISLICKKI